LIKETEQNAELCRKVLANQYSFNSYAAFDILKDKYQNYFTRQDLNDFLTRNNLYALNQEVNLLFQRYDQNKDGIVNFDEVILFI
jgi:Ca2+-binding EF-hand superfamily protein